MNEPRDINAVAITFRIGSITDTTRLLRKLNSCKIRWEKNTLRWAALSSTRNTITVYSLIRTKEHPYIGNTNNNVYNAHLFMFERYATNLQIKNVELAFEAVELLHHTVTKPKRKNATVIKTNALPQRGMRNALPTFTEEQLNSDDPPPVLIEGIPMLQQPNYKDYRRWYARQYYSQTGGKPVKKK